MYCMCVLCCGCVCEATVARAALSEIVNHLLEEKLEERIIFDFIIDGNFLRSSLLKHLLQIGKSVEAVTTVEYLRARKPPEREQSLPHDDCE